MSATLLHAVVRAADARTPDADLLDRFAASRDGEAYAELVRRLPWLNVFGGCCGTDTRHVDAIAAACAPLFEPSERMAS